MTCDDTETWDDILDFDFLRYLSRTIILLNLIDRCFFHGKKSDWDTLPHNRSLFNSLSGCGLPIGNLTSQLFCNVYISVFDDFIKRDLRVLRYGRYVDDSFIVSNDIDYLHSLIPKITAFLAQTLKLKVNAQKTEIRDSHSGSTPCKAMEEAILRCG